MLDEATQAARAKDFAESKAMLDKVFALEKDNLRAHDLAGFVLFFMKHYKDAEQHCIQALRIKPNHAYALKGYGLCVARQGRIDEGVESLEKAIAQKPAWSDPYWDLAVVLSEAQRVEDAICVLKRGIDNVPSKKERFEGFVKRLYGKLDKEKAK